MSRLSRERHQKRLTECLSRADDEQFFQLIWAVDRYQSGDAQGQQVAGRLVRFPEGARSCGFGSNYFVYKWKLENLIGELLATRRNLAPKRGAIPSFNSNEFNALATIANMLEALENSESGVVLERVNVLDEMPRIAQQQFSWQRGFFNISDFYRSMFVFANSVCDDHFRNTHGLSIEEFSLVGFAMASHFLHQPILSAQSDVTQLGLRQDAFGAAMQRLCLSIENARDLAKGWRGVRTHRGLYERSVLRLYPCVAFGEQQQRIRSPLLDLMVERITSGLFYDLVPAPGQVRNAISRRFEEYCQALLVKALPSHSVVDSYKYAAFGRTFDTPDALVYANDSLIYLVECKARRMSFEAKFGERPLEDAQSAFDELVTAIVQLWRYFSHARRGIGEHRGVRSDAIGIVMTMEQWFSMSRGRYVEILKRARERALQKDAEITEEDCRPIAFCPIQGVEELYSKMEDEGVFDVVVRAAATEKFSGYMLSGVLNEHFGKMHAKRPYPFKDKIGEVMPWWDRIK